MHQVGTGVLGPVYLARESDGDRAVAIKSFHLDLTPEQVEVFANALAHIVNVEASHPAIVAPLAAGLESGTPFMAYEYVEAESLDVVLRREARPAEGLAWISALADAVDAAHALGLVHGALHLRDVLVTSEGVCATGFGIASALEHVRLGFPVRRPYTAPEVTAGRRWGPPADRFAVAVLAYELLTGARPSAAGDEPIADLVDLRPDVADPAGLQQAFRNALAEDPGIRSASAAGFAAALSRAIGDESGASRPAAAPAGTAFAAGSEQESAAARPAARLGEDGHGDYETSFGSPHEPDAAAGSEGGAAGRAPTPPVQIALPDALGGLEEQDADAGAGTAGGDDGGSRGARSRRPAHPPRSKRRPPYRSEAPRRSGPVVAVRDEVQWDPLDEPRAAQPSAPGPAYGDDDVPPPPSPTSIRTVAPVVAAMAVGVVVAYLVSTGLGTSGDERVGVADPPSESAGAGVEWSEQTVAGSGGAPLSVPAGGAQAPGSPQPQALVEEPVVPVGDPPMAGGAPPPRPVVPDSREQSPPVPETAAAAVPVEPPAAAGSLDVAAAAPGTALPPAAGAGPSADPTAAAAGSLYVDSRPVGAAVSVDDVVVGVTPMEVSGVDFGARRVRIELPGYRPWATEVDVSGAERIRVAARLEPEGRR